jgi:di/tricarboxylate transporter
MSLTFLCKPSDSLFSAAAAAAAAAVYANHALCCQVVVSHHDLVGKRLKDVRFRHTYGAAVLGLHRSGQPVAGSISEVPLKAGDVLVVEAGPEFAHNFKNNRAFSLISEVPNSSPMKRNKMWIALALTVAMVLTQVRCCGRVCLSVQYYGSVLLQKCGPHDGCSQ